MARRNTEILAVRDVHRSLAPRGDIRREVALQNDVNSLIARLERQSPPWVAIDDGGLARRDGAAESA